MKINNVLKEQKNIIELDKNSLTKIKTETKRLVELLKEEIIKQKIEADVFVGGSLVKGTLVRNGDYDIDVFVRFDWRFDDISNLLKKLVLGVTKKFNSEMKLVHGSRDYYKLEKTGIEYEIIPVYKIKRPRDARNVTDLSYFHVNYVKRKLRGTKLASEILLAKQFCSAAGVYGAESYINGFSGYGLECLIIYYKSFLKMLKELIKIEGRVVLDPEKKFKNKNEALFSLNESKLQSPIILVDPTWKERNVLAALNKESFLRFQERARAFLKKPSLKFFEVEEINEEKLKKIAKSKKAEFVHIEIITDRQEGDVAGTKMKKFSRFLEMEIGRYFSIIEGEFSYLNGQKAELYLVAKPKNKIFIYGPPASMEKNAKDFKKRHKNVYERNGKLYSKIRVNFSCKSFLKEWINKNGGKISEMGIVGVKVG